MILFLVCLQVQLYSRQLVEEGIWNTSLELWIQEEALCTALIIVFHQKSTHISSFELRRQFVFPPGSECWRCLNQVYARSLCLVGELRTCRWCRILIIQALQIGTREFLINNSLWTLFRQQGNTDRISEWLKLHHFERLVQNEESSVQGYLICVLWFGLASERANYDRNVEVMQKSIAEQPSRGSIDDFKDLLYVFQDIFQVLDEVQKFVKLHVLLRKASYLLP